MMGKFDPTPGPWERIIISREEAIQHLCNGGHSVEIVGLPGEEPGNWQIVALLPHQGLKDDRDESNAELVRSAYCLGTEPILDEDGGEA